METPSNQKINKEIQSIYYDWELIKRNIQKRKELLLKRKESTIPQNPCLKRFKLTSKTGKPALENWYQSQSNDSGRH